MKENDEKQPQQKQEIETQTPRRPKSSEELGIDEIIKAEGSEDEEEVGPLKSSSNFTYVTNQPKSPLSCCSRKGAMYYSGGANQTCQQQQYYSGQTCYQPVPPPNNGCYYPPGYHPPGCQTDAPNYYPANPSRGSDGCWTCIKGLLACTLCIACLKCCCCCCDCDCD